MKDGATFSVLALATSLSRRQISLLFLGVHLVGVSVQIQH
jgi:hypothetical protein